MSRALPGVVRQGAVRRRRAIRRAVIIALVSSFVWIAATFGIGMLSYTRDLCTSCHAMKVYAQKASEGTHSGVQCFQCHRTSGPLGALPDGFALQRRAIRSVFGAEPGATSITHGACHSCHESVHYGVSVARGIRVRHMEFIETPCTECHGGVSHELDERHYAVPEMESCMSCHTASPNDAAGCTMCHSRQTQRERRETDNSWRVTHGPAWKTAHGLGELQSCRTCHEASKCAECHGTPIPHVPDWSSIHGVGITNDKREACGTCHSLSWCDGCHGVPMPHPAKFFETHGPFTKELGAEVCARCHPAVGCEDCHMRADHKKIPGLRMEHGEGR